METAKAAEFFLSDGVIITGSSTGEPVQEDDLTKVKNSLSLPILLGSGVTAENVKVYMNANAFIVGSYFKEDGLWYNEVDPIRVRNLMEKIQHIRTDSNTH